MHNDRQELKTPEQFTPSPAEDIKRSKRRWRDKQGHAGKEVDANKIDPSAFFPLIWV